MQTVPVPTEETSEKLIPVSSTVQAGSVSVLRVYPLLAHPESAGDSGSGSSSLSSESVVISCSYTTVVSYTRAGKPSEVVNCVSKLVTAEDQIRTILSYRGVEILSNPDCEVSLENTCSTDAPRLGPRAQVIYPRTVLLGLGQLHSVGAVPVIRGKLYQICLDLGLIVRDRRDAIDKLMKGEISTSKLSEKLSKNTARRIIILETCLSCNLVNTICEYITALDSARFGYRHSSTSKSAEMIHSYANVQDYLSGGSGVENSGPREATAAGVDVGYVLRDVTRVHQWAVLLLEQLRTMAKDTILLRFVVPYLIAKGDNITGSAHITDMPVGYTRELASYICLCEGAVAVFRALVTRKTMEVISAAAAIEEEAEHETFTAAVPWTATSLLDGQCVVAEAVVAVLKIASLACSTRGVSLPRQQSPSLLRNHDERTQADPEYLQLADNICDIQSFFGDVSAQMFKQRSNYSTPTLMLIQDLLVQYIDKFCRVVTDSDTASFISRSGYLSATLGDVRNREDTSPAELSRHADRLSALLYSPVILALTVQKQGLKFAAANLGLTLSSAASREEALDIFYIPIRHALASIEYTLLDTIDITCGAYDENAIFGFAGKFGCACGSQAGKSLSPTFLFPPSWSQSVAAIWMIESGFSTTVSIQVLQSYSFESFFESSSAIYRMQSSCFLPISPEVLFRYVLHRFLFRGDWKSAKSLLRSQTSAGGTAGGLGIETYDLTPLLLSPENKLNFGPSSRARCIILTLGLAMLQLDEWQSAWHTTRKLCYGQSDLISVELIDMFCKWLFFYNKATEIINFTFMEEVGSI